ncbi:MAG TPA: tetratricopeptide repeat protein [Gemmatimonadales bacterium]|nr:tetratricopeptide repeat protein [Gemmatimonadales bacterium]
MLSLVLLVGCAGSAANHEELGDAAYMQGDFSTALGEYHAATLTRNTARVWDKLAVSALKLGELRDAADGFSKVADLDPTRKVEAARGLEMVARAADRAGNEAGLRESVADLRRLAPERVNSRYTIALVKGGSLEPAEAAGIGPLALAAASDASSVDQMLVQYGAALQRTTDCADAMDPFQTALRRSRDATIRARAIEGLGSCGVQLGLEALLVDHPDVASGWFQQVLAVDSTSDRGRRALVGLGDARVRQGDLLGATIAYQDAMRPGSADTITALAGERLQHLGASAATADSR